MSEDENQIRAQFLEEVAGTLINESQMLAEVLKKNSTISIRSTVEDLDNDYGAGSGRRDIEWYIPAYGQFAGAPAWYGGATMASADFWSSTAGAVGLAYIGSGVDRLAHRNQTPLVSRGIGERRRGY